MERIYKFISLVLLGGIVCLSVYGYFRIDGLRDVIRRKDDELAQTAKTVQLWQGMYAKKAQEVNSLTTDNEALKKEIAAKDEEIIALTEVNVTLVGVVKRYKECVDDGKVVAKGMSCRPEVIVTSNDNTPTGATKLSFNNIEDFGFVKSSCDANVYVWKDGSKPYAADMTISLLPGKPLKLDMYITRNSDGEWTTYAKSSDDSVQIDIGKNQVSVDPLRYKWYEKIGVNVDIGVGKGFLGGIGVNYEFDKFKLGPSMWGVTANGQYGVFYGVNVDWTPFRQVEMH